MMCSKSGNLEVWKHKWDGFGNMNNNFCIGIDGACWIR